MTFPVPTLPTFTGGPTLVAVAVLLSGCTDTQPTAPETTTAPTDPVAEASAVLTAAAPVGVVGAGTTLETADIFGQAAAGERETVYAQGAATLRRTPNGFSVRVQMPTPAPGTYEYPEGAKVGHPEAFTLWIFANGVPFWGAGHVAGGRHLILSGHVSKTTVPFTGGEPLGPDVANADVRITIAPHGTVDPDKLPDQIQTPSGTDPFWWVADFE
jgi:hypothetical protein